jgi:hypothetical protein
MLLSVKKSILKPAPLHYHKIDEPTNLKCETWLTGSPSRPSWHWHFSCPVVSSELHSAFSLSCTSTLPLATSDFSFGFCRWAVLPDGPRSQLPQPRGVRREMQSRRQHRRLLRNHGRWQCRGLQLLQHTTAGPQICSPWSKIADLKV